MADDRNTAEFDGHRVVLVTGPSGAGRSTAINALEDLGFEVIDNLPLSLAPRLIDGPPIGHPLALGLDVRNRDFSVGALLDLIRRLADESNVMAEVLYIDAAPEVLVRRYSETRRRHPLAPQETPEAGITREIELLEPVRAQAGHVIDTTNLTPHDLRAELQARFDPEPQKRMSVTVQSFSYKRGLPRGVDIVFDCRFLRNPHWEPSLRALDGRDPRVAEYVEADDLAAPFFVNVQSLVELLLPAHRDEGRMHLTIGFGCTGGQHRSVAMTEKLVDTLAKAGWQVSKRHRELERRTGPARASSHGVTGQGVTG